MKYKNDFLVTFHHVTFNIAFLSVVIVLFAAGWYAFGFSPDETPAAAVLYATVFLLIAGIAWGWLWVMIKIPQEMNARYDAIKNQIASGEIANADDFAKSLAAFLVEYFDFCGFDVVAAQVGIKNHKPFIFPEENALAGGHVDDKTLAGKSRETERLISLGKIAGTKEKLYGYLVPVWFDKQWLGYFCVFTNTRLNTIYQKYLLTFETYHVDDQMMFVLQKESVE